MLDYVERTFPPGTPLEELDVEVLPALAPDLFPRPVIQLWEVAGMGGFLTALIFAVSPHPTAIINSVSTADVVYKHPLELWLDVLRDEYERDVIRSPLERGVLLSETRTLDTCFAFSGGSLAVSNSAASVVPLAPLALSPAAIDIGGVRDGALDRSRDVRAQGIEVVTRWNALELQLATLLNNGRGFSKQRLDEPRLLDVLLGRWSKLAPNDPNNLDLNAASSALGLSAEHRRLLKAAGATDLRGIAGALQSAARIERYNAGFAARKKGERAKSIGEPIAAALSIEKANEMRRAIGGTIAKSLAGARES
jgi:hypothetical protein